MKKLALLLMLMAPLASAQDWMATSFDHTEVTPGIYMLTGADGKMSGGGIGLLVGDEYVVLIDDSFTPLAALLSWRTTSCAAVWKAIPSKIPDPVPCRSLRFPKR